MPKKIHQTPANADTLAETQRLNDDNKGKADWKLWGPYLAERAWGTVREDYSAKGKAWDYFPHEHSHSRAYRWNEDGMGGISDIEQRLCLAPAFHNGRDPILKERAFGLTGKQGNHGEDVKEIYFYQDASPTHSYLQYRYIYPQQAFPYQRLISENQNRSRHEPGFNLVDTGLLEQGYWDISVEYAKQTPEHIYGRITVKNCGHQREKLLVIPQLWFRNTWSWGDTDARPGLQSLPDQSCSCVKATHESLGSYYFYTKDNVNELFTENDSNKQLLWQEANETPYVKDAFHRYLIQGEEETVNTAQRGTKMAYVHELTLEPQQQQSIEICLVNEPLTEPFKDTELLWRQRQKETSEFYQALLPDAEAEDHQIMRQALAGMIWTKQFFHFNVERWIKGDQVSPPETRRTGRNAQWQHMQAADIISMPDCWEYPWFAAWDLAFQAATLSLIDIQFAKSQISLMVSDRYLHPNGQIPAYEWSFSDVNPPVHAMGALKVFRAERIQTGKADTDFLEQVFHKLLLNYAWWINRKDAEGHNLFEGGFLGLDNISVYNRSEPLPHGYTLKQADASGWMAMFALNMTVMALEINLVNPDYEDIAIQCYKQFMAIAHSMSGADDAGVSLWDFDDGFYKDLLITPEQQTHRIDVYSWVGLIPLFATEVVDQRMLNKAPRFRALLKQHRKGQFRGNYICACPEWQNDRGEHLLAVVDHSQLPRILQRLLNEDEFLSSYGIRSISKYHETHKDLGHLPGIGYCWIEYIPGESNSAMFGGNSNWRGPVWLPTNYALIQALEKYHRFLGENFTVPVPCLDNKKLNLQDIANLISERLVNLYRKDDQQSTPAMRKKYYPIHEVLDTQPLYSFYEYFHAETGEGLGAAHQTGWTGLLANLIMRKYRRHIPPFWIGEQ
jgi:hypothetical protein